MRISDWSSDVCSSDLDAPLQYEEGGGGRVSYAYGIHGGFTIANAVTIENAVGGSGNDTLTGNEASHVLCGGVGHDGLAARAASERLGGGAGTPPRAQARAVALLVADERRAWRDRDGKYD